MDASRLRTLANCKGKIKEVLSEEEILKLAKDGIIPHYIITNPLTKEESIWFNSAELTEWFENNCVRYQEAYFTQQYSFLSFDRSMIQPRSTPDELSRIKDLYHLPMEYINTPPGVYFLCRGSKIVYIGKARNVANRITTHVAEGRKKFDNAYFITCNINQLDELEMSLIKFYQPEYNIAMMSEAEENHRATVAGLTG